MRTAARAVFAGLFTVSVVTFTATAPAFAANGARSSVKVCGTAPAAGFARCLSQRRTDADATGHRPDPGKRPKARPDVLGNNGAYDPSYLQSAYNLTTASAANGAGVTVAVVDAYDSPTAESDMDYYRANFGLPPCPASTCFTKVDQNGGTAYPAVDTGWAQEISLDLDMASAICPNCKILLVEATTNSFTNLGTAVDTAASLGAAAISNSYGGSEFSGELTYDSQYYNHPGVAVTASSGDNGYGVGYPAASQYVTGVGGTTLNQLSNTGTRNATETAWSGAGSGCSTYEAKPSWQADAGCARRTVADVSAVADPNTGVWVYYNNSWYVFGGTSVASPIIASVYALNGKQAINGASSAYANTWALNDVVSGSNGSCGTYLCTAAGGYDGPTGLGTPNGIAAFAVTPDFALSASPASQSVAEGAPASYTITASPIGGFNGSVSLGVSGAPGDSTPSFSANPISVSANAGTSTLTLSSGTAGTYPLTIMGTSGSLAHATTVTLVVNAPNPDFTITVSPASRTISRTGSTTYLVTITPANGFNSAVALSVSGLPSRTSASFSPNPATTSSTLSISTTRKTWTGTYSLTITASGGGVTHTANVTLIIQ